MTELEHIDGKSFYNLLDLTEVEHIDGKSLYYLKVLTELCSDAKRGKS